MGDGLSYRMNPMDYVLLAKHESLQRRGYCGLNVMLLVEAQGALPADAMASAVKRLGCLYPALSAHVRYSRILRRPYWHIEADASLECAVEYVHHNSKSDGEDAWTPFQNALDETVDVHCGPQLRVIHIQVDKDRHRLGLCWGHPLMDMEGAHLLLRALAELLCDRAPTLGADPRAVLPPPFPVGPAAAVVRAWQGRWLYGMSDGLRQPRIVKKPEGAPKRCRFMLRTYPASQRRQFEALAAKRTGPGPLRYSRAMLVGLARAYRRMATERGRPRSHYLVPLPLPVPRSGPRPGVHGNHVTIPFIVLQSDELLDWRRADAAAAAQFRAYFEKRRDVAMWCMYRAASHWPLGLTSLLTTHRRPRAAAGLTGYQFDGSVTRLGSAAVTNLACVGPMDCHPGWILARTTFGDTMTLSITYFEDYFDTPNVQKFFNLLERELLEEAD